MSTPSLLVLVALFVSFIKPFVEMVLAPAHPLHDPIIRFLAVASGVGGELIFQYTTTGIPTGPAFWSAALTGFVAGVGAVGGYHVLSLPSSLGTPPPTPAAAAAPPAPRLTGAAVHTP